MSTPGIRVENVWKKFHRGEIHDSLRDLIPAVAKRMMRRGPRTDRLAEGDFWALRELDFQVEAGEAVGIIGRNGAGKSTALKILTRILRPNIGSIRVQGRVGALIEIAAGFHPDLTGRENTYLQGSILGLKKSEIDESFEEIVEFAGLGEFIDTPVKRYSSGMNARLGFSIATSLRQEVLLIDEVLSVGDYDFQRKCSQRMKDLLGSGCAVVFVSHNLQAVSSLCQRAILLDKGSTAVQGPAIEVVQAYLDGAVASSVRRKHGGPRLGNVVLRNEQGPCTDFNAGERAWVDVEVSADTLCEDFSVVLYMLDSESYNVFSISTSRLDLPPLRLEAGQSWRGSFELNLHLAPGSFYLGVAVRRSAVNITYDRRFPAATVHMHGGPDSGGRVNLYPSVSSEVVVPGEEHGVPQPRDLG